MTTRKVKIIGACVQCVLAFLSLEVTVWLLFRGGIATVAAALSGAVSAVMVLWAIAAINLSTSSNGGE